MALFLVQLAFIRSFSLRIHQLDPCPPEHVRHTKSTIRKKRRKKMWILHLIRNFVGMVKKITLAKVKFRHRSPSLYSNDVDLGIMFVFPLDWVPLNPNRNHLVARKLRRLSSYRRTRIIVQQTRTQMFTNSRNKKKITGKSENHSQVIWILCEASGDSYMIYEVLTIGNFKQNRFSVKIQSRGERLTILHGHFSFFKSTIGQDGD